MMIRGMLEGLPRDMHSGLGYRIGCAEAARLIEMASFAPGLIFRPLLTSL